MKIESQKAIKKIVNESYNCKLCKNRKDCRFWKGEILSLYLEGCTADEFAEGVQATLEYLASIPWDKAMNVIVDSVKEE